MNMQKLRTEEEKKLGNPYDSASFLSFVFFGWLTPLIDLGAKRTLEFDDVHHTPFSLSSSVVSTLFQTIWDEEQRVNPGSGAKNLGWMLAKCSIRPLMLSAFNFSLFAVVSLLQPYFIVKILEYVANGEVNFLGMKSGIMISVGLALLSFIGIVSFAIGFTQVQEVGFRTRNILIAKIFNKSLKVSNFARNNQTTGEIVTLMSADTERYWVCVLLSNWLWLSPSIIAISLILLIHEFGFAAVIVSAVVGLWFIAFSKSSSMVGFYRAQIVKLTEERVKLMNEALQGIRVIKLYAWEDPTVERIEFIRKQETDLMMQYQLTKMFNTVS
jgi:ABC-type multidrug transport system fused ATPase/permease subunit